MPDAPVFRWRGLVFGIAAVATGAALVVYSTWRVDRLTLRSHVLGERRSVLIRLPRDYERTNDRYAVLYLLDGGDRGFWSGDEPLYSRAKALLDRLEERTIPETILVGVSNRNRVRDMTPVERPDVYAGGGGAAAFLQFLTEELAPFIDARYRTSARRLIYGESYGGLFVVFALAERPDAFTDYIAVSPAVGVCPDLLVERLGARFSARPDLAVSLFVAYGEHDAPLVTQHAAPLLAAVEPMLPVRLRVGHRVFGGAGHNPPAGLDEGLRFVFSPSGEPSGGS